MKKAKYCLTLKEAIEVLQIISIHKKVEVDKATTCEKAGYVRMFDTLIDTILLGNHKDDTITYEATNRVEFGIWSAVDMYKEYLIESGYTGELEKIDNLLAKLACKA